MEGFGIDKLLLILVIVLVLFGARRVPEIGASIGKGIREFKRGMQDLGSEDKHVHGPDDAQQRLAPPTHDATAHEEERASEPRRLL